MAPSPPTDTDHPAAPIFDAMPHPAAPEYPMALARLLASVSMEDVFAKKPFPWQEDVIAHMNLMTASSRGIPPGAILLVQPTGGGKSMVRDTFAAAHGGIHWSVSPLLSLTADQESKLNASAIQDDGAVIAVNLDLYRTPKQRSAVLDSIRSLPPNTSTTVMIFSSPQALTDIKQYSEFFKDLTDFESPNGGHKLRSFTVDEVHLFCQFGMYFRSEFLRMKSAVFQRLQDKRSNDAYTTHCPILVMTGTCNKTVVNQFEKMSGVTFHKPTNIFWPNAAGMRRRTAAIRLHVTTHVQKVLNSEIGRIVHPYKSVLMNRKQFIAFGNSRKAIELLHSSTKAEFDRNQHHGDLVLITGPMLKEQKFYYTNLFLNSEPTPDSTKPIAERSFDAIGCFATRALGSAGWDGPNVHMVFSMDFPTDILSARQEIGRCGRRVRDVSLISPVAGDMDSYVMVFSLTSVKYLIQRMYLKMDKETTKDIVLKDQILSLDEHRAMLWDNILELLKIFVLPVECLHASLERKLANPYESGDAANVEIEPCGNACDYCDGKYSTLFPRVVHKHVKKALVDIFTGPNSTMMPTLDKSLVLAFRNYPKASRFLFASKSKSRPEPRTINKLILMLLASEMITYRIHYDDEDEDKAKPIILARLNSSNDGSLFIENEAAWSRIPSKAPL
jgi:hypothetical protein